MAPTVATCVEFSLDAEFHSLPTDFKKDVSRRYSLAIESIATTQTMANPVATEPSTDASTMAPTHVVITLKKGVAGLSQILKLIEVHDGQVMQLETRQAREGSAHDEAFLSLAIERSQLLDLIKVLNTESLGDLRIVNEQSTSEGIWFPRHITDLDFCTNVLTKFEPDLDADHPGYSDVEYRARRKRIAEIAFDYKEGQIIPDAEYSEAEVKTWGQVYNEVKRLAPTCACKEFNEALAMLEQEIGYGPHAIPQLQTVSEFLQKKSGFRIRPASGLLTARDFLASLAFRVFQCTQYVRHATSPQHSPEPDCIHELIGHIPMFAIPQFAEFSQQIGLASLGASDEDIDRLGTLYWFTVEFGLCKEKDGIRAYGAGLLSSTGELKHALSSKPAVLPFDPVTTAVQKYQDQEYQDTYFLAESFLDVQDKFRAYVQQHIKRPFELSYDAYTSSVIVLDTPAKADAHIRCLQRQISHLRKGLQNLQCSKEPIAEAA